MSKPTEQELKEFVNALQLSIKTKITAIKSSDANEDVILVFDSQAKTSDNSLHIFLRCFEGDWVKDKKSFIIHNSSKLSWPKLTLFLLLTRLNEDNIVKLAELDASAKEIAEKIGLKSHDANIDSIKKCSQIAFSKMASSKITIRELAGRTGITQVTISNFRAGRDVRLSNVIKIFAALGIKLMAK